MFLLKELFNLWNQKKQNIHSSKKEVFFKERDIFHIGTIPAEEFKKIKEKIKDLL